MLLLYCQWSLKISPINDDGDSSSWWSLTNTLVSCWNFQQATIKDEQSLEGGMVYERWRGGGVGGMVCERGRGGEGDKWLASSLLLFPSMAALCISTLKEDGHGFVCWSCLHLHKVCLRVLTFWARLCRTQTKQLWTHCLSLFQASAQLSVTESWAGMRVQMEDKLIQYHPTISGVHILPCCLPPKHIIHLLQARELVWRNLGEKLEHCIHRPSVSL